MGSDKQSNLFSESQMALSLTTYLGWALFLLNMNTPSNPPDLQSVRLTKQRYPLSFIVSEPLYEQAG